MPISTLKETTRKGERMKTVQFKEFGTPEVYVSEEKNLPLVLRNPHQSLFCWCKPH